MEDLRVQLSDLQQRVVKSEVRKDTSDTHAKDRLQGLHSTVTELRQLLEKARQSAADATEKHQEAQKLLEKEIQNASAARAQHKTKINNKAKALLAERQRARKLAAKANALEEKLRLATR